LHLDTQEVRPAETSPAGVSGSQGASSRSAITSGEAGSPDNDTVTISTTSSAIARLATEHSSKIAKLAEAVRTGNYHMSSNTLSSAIVSGAIR